MNNINTTPDAALRFTESRVVARPAEAVWSVIADYGMDPEWRHGVATMAPSEPGLVEPGLTTMEDMRFGGRRYRNGGRVVSVDGGRAFSWETTSGTRARGSRSVVPTGEHESRFELHLELEPTGPDRFFTPVLRPLLSRRLAKDADRLAGLLVEGALPADPVHNGGVTPR